MAIKKNVLFSQDFFPIYGGAHLWLYEVYKRWGSEVSAIVQDYQFDNRLYSMQRKFDTKEHGFLEIIRKDIKAPDINILSRSFHKTIKKNIGFIDEVCCNEQTTINVLRAFPEGISGCVYKILHPKSCKLITYAHGEEILIALTSKQLLWSCKLVYFLSDLIIANSYSTKKLVQSIAPKAQIEVVYPGVDYKRFLNFSYDSSCIRAKWSVNDNEILLFSMARIETRKNHISVIKAVKMCIDNGINIKYLIASDGDEKDRLVQMVKEQQFENFVIFIGYLSEEEKISTLFSCDIHIMPSIQNDSTTEGFGIVFLEAAAAGVPSISGNVGGQPESVINGKTGFVVDGNDIPEIAKIISTLCADEKLRKKMGNCGRKWAKENDWDNVANKIKRISNKI